MARLGETKCWGVDDAVKAVEGGTTGDEVAGSLEVAIEGCGTTIEEALKEIGAVVEEGNVNGNTVSHNAGEDADAACCFETVLF